MDIAFDIETADLPREQQEARCKPFIDTPFVDAPFPELKLGNAKKPETIQAKRHEYEKAKAEYEATVDERREAHERSGEERRRAYYDDKLKKSRLKAHQSQVLCYSIYSDEGGECHWADGDEAGLLRELFTRIDQAIAMDYAVIGANVINFDIPFIYRRGLFHGLQPEKLIYRNLRNGRYEIDPGVYDVLRIYQGPEYGTIPPIGLDALATCFGIEGKTEASGAKFAELAVEDRARAEAYAIADSRIAFEIYQAMHRRPEVSTEPTPF